MKATSKKEKEDCDSSRREMLGSKKPSQVSPIILKKKPSSEV